MVSIREYAFQAGCFVICAQGLLREQDFEPEYKSLLTSDHLNIEWANGGSCVVNPFGEFIAEPVIDEDTIIYADCYANEIKCAKAYFDGLGHYSRPDVAKLLLNTDHNTNLNFADTMETPSADYKYLKQLSEEYEIKLARLEKLANRLESKKNSFEM